jgi:hypothetical protein
VPLPPDAGGSRRQRHAAALRRRWALHLKAVMWRLKDDLEAGRSPGTAVRH